MINGQKFYMNNKSEIFLNEILVLRVCNSNGKSYGGFQWPLEVGTILESTDWNDDIYLGGGFIGLPRGEGNPHYIHSELNTQWVLLAVDTTKYNCNFKSGRIVYIGTKEEALDIIQEMAPENSYIINSIKNGKDNCMQTGGCDSIHIAENSSIQVSKKYSIQISENESKQTVDDNSIQTANNDSCQTANNDCVQVAGIYTEQNASDNTIQIASDWAKQKAGYKAVQTSGDSSKQVSSYLSRQITGDNSVQTAGHNSIQISGNWCLQTVGNFSKQITKDNSVQTAGHNSKQCAGVKSAQICGAESIQICGNCSTQTAGMKTIQIVKWLDDGEIKTKKRIVDSSMTDKSYYVENGIWIEVK